MKHGPASLLVAAGAFLILPFALGAAGLTLTTATDLVIFAVACMGLNILVGNTGLVSFGHGAFFGLGAYAAALSQRHWFPGEIVLPALFSVGFVAIVATIAGFLILRRRGVYFSLLTLALTAMLYAIAFRWTAFTGGESGLGGVVRPLLLSIDLSGPWTYYWTVAAIGFGVICLLWRFHRSPVGSVLIAVRENEQRARFIGYATDRYKLLAFAASATVTAIAGTLSVFNHRFASADPLSVQFSGELLAMVVIGGMRSFLGPALGALFFILFREFLSIWTPHWLLLFGLLFMGFIVFSPTGLVGVAERLIAPWRARVIEAAAMAAREIAAGLPLPTTLLRESGGTGPVLVARGLFKSFGGIRAVHGIDLDVRDRTLHALIGPNGAGKTTAFNLLSGLYPPDEGSILLDGRSIAGLKPEDITRAGIGRSFQITNLFGGLSVEENVRLAVQARHRERFAVWTGAAALADVNSETAECLAYLGLYRARGGGLALLRRPAGARHGARARGLPARPAARRAARRACRRRAPSHRRAGQGHFRAYSDPAGRARYRPGFSDRRSGHGDERGRGAPRRRRRGGAHQREGARDLHRLGRRRGGGEAEAVGGGSDRAADDGQGRHVLRQEPHPQ